MNTEKLIKVALAHAEISQAELAKRCGMSPPSFNARMKRGTFLREDMEKMAKAMDMEFVFTFRKKDGTML